MNIYCNVSSVNITDGHGRVFEIIKPWFFSQNYRSLIWTGLLEDIQKNLVKQTEGQGKWLPNYAFVTRKIVLRAKINKHLTFSTLTYRRTIHDVDRKYKYLFNPIFQYILTEQSVNKLSGVLQYQQLTTQQIELANISCRVAKK